LQEAVDAFQTAVKLATSKQDWKAAEQYKALSECIELMPAPVDTGSAAADDEQRVEGQVGLNGASSTLLLLSQDHIALVMSKLQPIEISRLCSTSRHVCTIPLVPMASSYEF
jgi:hypothetical protein